MEQEQQGSYAGFSPSTYGAPPAYVPPIAPVPPVAAPQFRPLSTGEVLDRSFALYRQRFWLFVGIGMVPAAVLLVTSAARLIFLAATHHTAAMNPFPTMQSTAGGPPIGEVMRSLMLQQLYLLPATILFLLAYGVSHAATVDAVNRIGQGMVATAGESLREVRGRWLRWCCIVLLQFWSMLWPVLPGIVLAGVSIGIMARQGAKANFALIGSAIVLASLLVTAGSVLGVINFVRNTLAIAAGVSENIGVHAAMRRAKILAAGRKGRLFLAWLLIYALQTVVVAVQMPLLLAAVSLRGGAFIAVQAILLLVHFAAGTLVLPLASIVFTLFYIDERVRREGFDIELLMQRTLPPAHAYPAEI